jgi:hypothetical protein
VRSLRRPAGACLAALSLVAAAGCGSDTRPASDYVRAINRVQADFAKNVEKVRAAPAGRDPTTTARRTFRALGVAIDRVVADLRAVKPPAEVKSLHGRLIAEMGEFDTQVQAAGDALSSQSRRKILAAQSKFAAESASLGARVAKTIDAINRKLRG